MRFGGTTADVLDIPESSRVPCAVALVLQTEMRIIWKRSAIAMEGETAQDRYGEDDQPAAIGADARDSYIDAGEDDAAMAARLQAQYNQELSGELENLDLAFARQLHDD